MEKITGNEPINPIQPTFNSEGQVCNDRYDLEGLTIRQHFAAMAMQGILSANPKDTWGNSDMPVPNKVAVHSVNFADALIAELNNHQ